MELNYTSQFRKIPQYTQTDLVTMHHVTKDITNRQTYINPNNQYKSEYLYSSPLLFRIVYLCLLFKLFEECTWPEKTQALSTAVWSDWRLAAFLKQHGEELVVHVHHFMTAHILWRTKKEKEVTGRILQNKEGLHQLTSLVACCSLTDQKRKKGKSAYIDGGGEVRDSLAGRGRERRTEQNNNWHQNEKKKEETSSSILLTEKEQTTT